MSGGSSRKRNRNSKRKRRQGRLRQTDGKQRATGAASHLERATKRSKLTAQTSGSCSRLTCGDGGYSCPLKTLVLLLRRPRATRSPTAYLRSGRRSRRLNTAAIQCEAKTRKARIST